MNSNSCMCIGQWGKMDPMEGTSSMFSERENKRKRSSDEEEEDEEHVVKKQKGVISEEDLEDVAEEKAYTIEKVRYTEMRKYGVEDVVFRARFNGEYQREKLIELTDELRDMFAVMLEEVSRTYTDADRVRLQISHR